jgi:ornithine cyclodeaminase/alanine dehydrogenase-like protein (mu-crystallin family)
LALAGDILPFAFVVGKHYLSIDTHLDLDLDSRSYLRTYTLTYIYTYHRIMLSRASRFIPAASRAQTRAFAAKINPPRLFDYETVASNIKPTTESIGAIESAFGMLAKDLVDVPIPMHIGIAETANAGPGDCHIKGGYIEGTATWTVKLANVSFYKNLAKGLPAGSGIFTVCDATNGAPLAIFQENRYLTDMRTGAAGAVSVKHFCSPKHKKVAYIGAGVIGLAMARSTDVVHKFDEGFAYGLDMPGTQKFCDTITTDLGYKMTACATAEEAVRAADVIFTQTPGSDHVSV